MACCWSNHPNFVGLVHRLVVEQMAQPSLRLEQHHHRQMVHNHPGIVELVPIGSLVAVVVRMPMVADQELIAELARLDHIVVVVVEQLAVGLEQRHIVVVLGLVGLGQRHIVVELGPVGLEQQHIVVELELVGLGQQHIVVGLGPVGLELAELALVEHIAGIVGLGQLAELALVEHTVGIVGLERPVALELVEHTVGIVGLGQLVELALVELEQQHRIGIELEQPVGLELVGHMVAELVALVGLELELE